MKQANTHSYTVLLLNVTSHNVNVTERQRQPYVMKLSDILRSVKFRL
jgi:hypothetical protein